jgi:hypothetical protein
MRPVDQSHAIQEKQSHGEMINEISRNARHLRILDRQDGSILASNKKRPHPSRMGAGASKG